MVHPCWFYLASGPSRLREAGGRSPCCPCSPPSAPTIRLWRWRPAASVLPLVFPSALSPECHPLQGGLLMSHLLKWNRQVPGASPRVSSSVALRPAGSGEALLFPAEKQTLGTAGLPHEELETTVPEHPPCFPGTKLVSQARCGYPTITLEY